MLLFLCFLGLVGQSLAQIKVAESCQQRKNSVDFNETALLGQWFEWARNENVFETNQACGIVEYVRDHDGFLVDRFHAILRPPGTRVSFEGRVIPKSKDNSTYHLEFPDYGMDPGIQLTFPVVHWPEWAIVHGCTEEKDGSSQYVWVLAANLPVSHAQEQQILSALESLNLPMDSIQRVDHRRCPKRF